MLRIQRLKRPTKQSGFKLEPGKRTEMGGLLVTNRNKFAVYVDKFTRNPVKKKRK